MESKGRSIQDGDELQISSLQDKTVRLVSSHHAARFIGPGFDQGGSKVILRIGTSIVKGEVACKEWAELDRDGHIVSIKFRPLHSSVFESVSLADAKAVFFVKTFEGDPRHIELQFDDSSTRQEKLWVRLTFTDGEVMECLVDSGAELTLHNSFYATPVDPDCNHWLLHVFKNQLSDLHILGFKRTASSLSQSAAV